MRFAVIGDRGMLGHDLSAVLKERGEEVTGFNRSNFELTGGVEDLSRIIDEADVIVNCVAYTAVDAAESNVSEANFINGEFAGKLAQVAKSVGARFAHISTDYVFQGTSNVPLERSASLSPVNAYGRSKAIGEELIMQSGADFQIFRTAWLYGANGPCFPKSIARKLRSGEVARVVDDQFGQPTWTKDLSEVIYAHGVSNYSEQIVHAVSSGKTNWFSFAQAISKKLPDQRGHQLERIHSSDLKFTAVRPRYSVLENTQTKGPIIGGWADRWEIASQEILSSLI
jgi:dTDP-4-dehydrorhamnose reductase